MKNGGSIFLRPYFFPGICCAGAMVQCFIQAGGNRSTGAENSSSMVAAVRVKALMSWATVQGTGGDRLGDENPWEIWS